MKKQRQLKFEKVDGWGGKRKGAGRPRKTKLVSHAKRDLVSERTPLHITLKLRERNVSLRCGEIHEVFAKCAGRIQKFGVGILNYSLQSDHVHLEVEAPDNQTLGRAMCSFVSCFARAIRKIIGGAGQVFAGRFTSVVARICGMEESAVYVSGAAVLQLGP